MIWSQEGCLHQLLMISSASVNLIEVHWSHGALALDCWIAMTCVWSPSVEIQSFIALRIQLGFGESIRVLVKCLTECELMAYSQLSHTHSFISNCLVTSTTIFFFFFLLSVFLSKDNLYLIYKPTRLLLFSSAPLEFILVISICLQSFKLFMTHTHSYKSINLCMLISLTIL